MASKSEPPSVQLAERRLVSARGPAREKKNDPLDASEERRQTEKGTHVVFTHGVHENAPSERRVSIKRKKNLRTDGDHTECDQKNSCSPSEESRVGSAPSNARYEASMRVVSEECRSHLTDETACRPGTRTQRARTKGATFLRRTSVTQRANSTASIGGS